MFGSAHGLLLVFVLRSIYDGTVQVIDLLFILLTGPVSFQVPFIKENEFPFAVVNGSLPFQLVDFCNLAAAFLILHRQSND